ncbi:MAG TPA: TonB-dependent receptor [Pyrinomonadaceae bacterium]|nr:TonB-dependent receptor [Pyrinomonadaceae bacterium]
MRLKNTKLFILSAFALLSLPLLALAQTGGTIRGTITSDVNQTPIGGVSVEITQLRRSAETGADGAYQFTNLPPGRYTLVTHIEGFSDRAKTIVLTAGATGAVDFSLSLTALREEVTITATGAEESVFESFQSVNSVGSTRIKEQANTAIGEVLEREAGVSKRSFGPGSSRPSIRGFEGDRVLVLQDGIRNGSVGSQSGDHGEPVDTLNLERLEVIKGPATLLYGSNAIGGVVNAVTGDEDDAHPGLRGYFTGLAGSVNRQSGTSGGVEYGYKRFLFNANGNFINEGDYRTPLGRIPNSAARSYGGSTGLGYFGEKGYIRSNFSLDRRRYGIPYAPLFESGELLSIANGGIDCEEESADCQFNIFALRDAFADNLPHVPDEQIDIRMRRNNYRLSGGFRDLRSAIPQADFYVDFTDYRHEEIETEDGIDETATNFFNDTFTARGVFQQANYKNLTGRFGFEGYRRSYLTEGAEQLVDGRVRQNNFSAFALEEFNFDRVALQFGGRIETNRYRPTNPIYRERDFTGFSGAVGARFRLWEGGSFVTNFTSSYRAPALEELYNFGAHIGTVTFEVGDQNLERERSNGIELSLRQNLRRIRVNGSFFYYGINNFVYLAPQDEDGGGNIDVEDGLPVSAYLQDEARFVGADVTVDVDINDYLGAFFIGDVVSARLRDSVDTPLPRITPARARVGLDFRYKGLSVRPEAVFVSRKSANDVFALETPTAGYGLFNVNASYTYAKERYAHIFTFGGQNLNDKLYRNHVNFIKDLLPEPGRGVRGSYTIRFF